jgi:uncharacterized protein YcbK (DUF882 family)
MVVPYLMKSKQDTFLKKTPLPSATLTPDQKILFPAGQDLAVLAVGSIEPANKHLKITFDFKSLPTDTDSVAKALEATGLNTWYVFPDHMQMNGTELNNKPKDKKSTIVGVSKDASSPVFHEFALPGNKSKFNMASPVVSNGRMYWYEALHFDPKTKQYRPPEDLSVVDNIVKLATFDRDVARPFLAKHFGCQPADIGIIVNSLYRDPATNRAVGGASQSRHLNGDAIDCLITVKGKEQDPYQINKIVDSLLGSNGLASASCFTHFDLRGYYARWSYGF